MISRSMGLKAVTAAVVAISFAAAPVGAQIRPVDPNTAIDADLVPGAPGAPGTRAAENDTTVSRTGPSYDPSRPATQPQPETAYPQEPAYPEDPGYPADPAAPAQPGTTGTAGVRTGHPSDDVSVVTGPTYKKDDLIGAAENVFGKGAEGLAGIIEGILKDQGEPSAYIAGREASGAFVVGLRYGSGTLFHKTEGERPAYWTGPSLGFDVGGNASKTFVLVYNLYDSQELYKRFPAGEGNAYFVGGFTASYLRSGDVVLIPIRLGVGYRLGVSAGYMKFSEKQKWMPF